MPAITLSRKKIDNCALVNPEFLKNLILVTTQAKKTSQKIKRRYSNGNGLGLQNKIYYSEKLTTCLMSLHIEFVNLPLLINPQKNQQANAGNRRNS